MEILLGVSLFKYHQLTLDMADYGPEIDAALSSQQKLTHDRVLLWIRSAGDLPTLAKLYKITGEGYYRIEPELGKEAECKVVERYLLECIRQNISDNDNIESLYEAAATLHGWLRQLLESGDCDDIIKGVAGAITEMYLSSEEGIRDAIETGFLEHAMESAGLRPFFEHWSADSRLREAWERALEWGKAHPDFSWNLLQELRRLMENDPSK